MGLYDRDYVREEPRGFFLGGNRSVVTNLILLNVGVFLVDVLFCAHDLEDRSVAHYLSDWMEVSADVFHQPWMAWQLLTCGFAHDPTNIWHVAGNMFMLWLFGRDVETIYGRREFLTIYLTMIVVASLAWVVSQVVLFGGFATHYLLGASGAVAGIMILNVLHFPRRLFYFWGVFPVPAWLLATLYIGQDVMGYNNSLRTRSGGVAFEAHLAGAAFAFLYYYTGWNFGRLMPRRLSWSMLKRRPKLTLHQPPRREEDLGRQVDRILEKISREGEASLTQAERRTLEEASRHYQQRRR
jgi:membrane associated rhomboid family serine protease